MSRIISFFDRALHHVTSLGGRAPRELNLFLRYSFSGGAAAIADLFIVYALTEWARFHPITSGIVATLCSMVMNFLVVRYWSFKSTGNLLREFVAYTGIVSIGIGINFITYSSLVVFTHVPYLISRMIAIIIAWAWNYGMNRKFSFRHIGFHG